MLWLREKSHSELPRQLMPSRLSWIALRGLAWTIEMRAAAASREILKGYMAQALDVLKIVFDEFKSEQ